MGKDDLKQFIAQARLDEAVAQLLEQIKAYSPASKSDKSVGKLSDILIINSGKLHGLQHDKMLGVLDRQTEQLTMAQVQQAILYVIDELPDEFWNASSHHQTEKQNSGNEQTELLEAVDSLKQVQSGEFEYDLFVSFSSPDREVLQPVVEKLRGYGLRVFISDQNLKNYVGISFSETIEHALEYSQHFVLVCSLNSAESGWVTYEYETFFNQFHVHDRKNRHIFVLKGIDFDLKFVPLFLRTMQIADNAEQIINTLVVESRAQQQLKIKNEELKQQRLAAPKAEDEPSILVLNQQPTFAATHRSPQDPAASLRTINPNRKKLIYVLSPLLLIAFVVSIVYFSTKAPGPIKRTEIQQPENNVVEINSLSPPMVLVKGGEFMMGVNDSTEKDEKPAHKVIVSDFYIGKYEVTQKQWIDIMGTNPSYFKGCDNCPVESVSWDSVQVFIQKLNIKSGKTYRLPTEAEWEYACRAGTTTPFNTGNNLTTSQANYNGNYPYNNNPKGEYRGKTIPVGSFAPNALGCCDMHGNLWEWCSDWYGENYYDNSPQNNPKGPSTGSSRVVRGGSWNSYAKACQTAFLAFSSPAYRNYNLGFRLVFVP